MRKKSNRALIGLICQCLLVCPQVCKGDDELLGDLYLQSEIYPESFSAYLVKRRSEVDVPFRQCVESLLENFDAAASIHLAYC